MVGAWLCLGVCLLPHEGGAASVMARSRTIRALLTMLSYTKHVPSPAATSHNRFAVLISGACPNQARCRGLTRPSKGLRTPQRAKPYVRGSHENVHGSPTF